MNQILQESVFGSSIHGSHEIIDKLLAVAMLAPFNEVQPLLVQATGGGVQLEGPQEVGALCEGWADIVDLMDQVLDTNYVVLAQMLQRKNPVSNVRFQV